MIPRAPTCIIENVAPLVDGGRYPIKRAVGEDVHIEADIFKDGHDIISAVLKWRRVGAAKWHETPMAPLPSGNDRWGGTFSVFENAPYEFTIEAWSNTFLTWQHEFHAKFAAHQPDLTSETLEGAGVVEKSSQIAGEAGQKRDQQTLQELARSIREGSPEDVNAIGHSSELEALMAAYADRSEATQFILNLAPIPEIVSGSLPAPAISATAVQKKSAPGKPPRRRSTHRFSAQNTPGCWLIGSGRSSRSGMSFFRATRRAVADLGSTFRDCLPRVDDAIAMGFDVIYFPPIHPIGVTARKGRNNSVTAEPGEPGVPYAIGNRAQGVNGGGHKDVAPELGTLEDFDWLVGEIKKRGLEVALDFAINCSPDHPYVHDHPEWFYKRPDGTIKYAENPPKKYQDVYPLNFHNANWRMLWDELTDVILFWAKREVRIFRVDNPHTKPVAFWEYLITRCRSSIPTSFSLVRHSPGRK
jgi:starch synthase (maltosyl-transferring)